MSLHVAHNLDQHHQLTQARNLNRSDLMHHLVIDHGVSIRDTRSKGQLGRLHLLTHAVQAFPELRKLLNLPEGWGH